ncbi:hypothetical protein J8273_0926 [Carpediemonas membranifera]|uniref:Uncharacterized protein n=1 Tax=Carpediemonas membranifera TaxID=201153 RepID=A0A8J6C1C6_9EUKA|nr:hypothetical protein J8273_0926 [Carpediemonas membranifera]|eukprot:KAG9397431.1 hypothetical protein J8273_0926 [Carpediemonas membranifera]
MSAFVSAYSILPAKYNGVDYNPVGMISTGDFVIVASDSGEIYIYDAQTREVKVTFHAINSIIEHIEYNKPIDCIMTTEQSSAGVREYYLYSSWRTAPPTSRVAKQPSFDPADQLRVPHDPIVSAIPVRPVGRWPDAIQQCPCTGNLVAVCGLTMHVLMHYPADDGVIIGIAASVSLPPPTNIGGEEDPTAACIDNLSVLFSGAAILIAFIAFGSLRVTRVTLVPSTASDGLTRAKPLTIDVLSDTSSRGPNTVLFAAFHRNNKPLDVPDDYSLSPEEDLSLEVIHGRTPIAQMLFMISSVERLLFGPTPGKKSKELVALSFLPAASTYATLLACTKDAVHGFLVPLIEKADTIVLQPYASADPIIHVAACGQMALTATESGVTALVQPLGPNGPTAECTLAVVGRASIPFVKQVSVGSKLAGAALSSVIDEDIHITNIYALSFDFIGPATEGDTRIRLRLRDSGSVTREEVLAEIFAADDGPATVASAAAVCPSDEAFLAEMVPVVCGSIEMYPSQVLAKAYAALDRVERAPTALVVRLAQAGLFDDLGAMLYKAESVESTEKALAALAMKPHEATALAHWQLVVQADPGTAPFIWPAVVLPEPRLFGPGTLLPKPDAAVMKLVISHPRALEQLTRLIGTYSPADLLNLVANDLDPTDTRHVQVVDLLARYMISKSYDVVDQLAKIALDLPDLAPFGPSLFPWIPQPLGGILSLSPDVRHTLTSLPSQPWTELTLVAISGSCDLVSLPKGEDPVPILITMGRHVSSERRQAFLSSLATFDQGVYDTVGAAVVKSWRCGVRELESILPDLPLHRQTHLIQSAGMTEVWPKILETIKSRDILGEMHDVAGFVKDLNALSS